MANKQYKFLKVGQTLKNGDEMRYRNVGDGYRVVKPTEIVQNGDEFNYKESPSSYENYWSECRSQVGKLASTYSKYSVVRRKVELPKKVKPAFEIINRPIYFILDPQETIQEGDEYFDRYEGAWFTTVEYGRKPTKTTPYRRQINKG